MLRQVCSSAETNVKARSQHRISQHLKVNSALISKPFGLDSAYKNKTQQLILNIPKYPQLKKSQHSKQNSALKIIAQQF